MVGSKASRQELNRRRRSSGFIGRRGELSAFRENLDRDPQDEAFQYLFHLHGQAGVGKTSLIRQWETAAREREAVTAYLDDDVHSAIEAMETISTQLGRQQVVLRHFEKLLALYRQRRHEAEAIEATSAAPPVEDGVPQGQPTAASAFSTVMAQAGLAGLGMVPGLGSVAGVMDPQQLAHSTDRLRAALSTRLRSHDDVQLVLFPVQVLTPVFLRDVAEAAERHTRMVWFFDVFEHTGPVLNSWLRDVLTGEAYGELPANLVAVLSGQGRLDARCWGDHLDLVAEVPLDVFTEDEVRQLLAAHGVSDPGVIKVVLELTGRLPVLVDLLAQARPRTTREIGDPSDTAVERFLKWETDPHRRTDTQVCALPLQLDEDLFHTLAPHAAADEYTRLRGLPFVLSQAGRCRYHDVVRTPMLRLQRTQSPVRWTQFHTLLADTYQQRRHTLEATLPADRQWDDDTWREHRLNETYHRLCANPHQALPDALLDCIHACDHDTDILRRWARTLTQAGHDADSTALTSWGDRLRCAADDGKAAGTAIPTVLLTARELGTGGRALAYAVRGSAHRNTGHYDQAIGDYTAAVGLDQHLARAYTGRGDVHRLLGRYDEALADLDHAVALEPHNPRHLVNRSHIHRLADRPEKALTDLSHALDLDPQSSYALMNRGNVHHDWGRYHDALSDLNHAVELAPDSRLCLTSRAVVLHELGRYEEVLADLAHALDLDPQDDLALFNRAFIHQAQDHYEDALADYSRVIALDPEYSWSLAPVPKGLVFIHRAMVLHELGRYEEVLADLAHALDLNPQDDMALAARASIYQAQEHYEDALADYTRALEINPAHSSYHLNIAVVLRLLGRPEEQEHWRRGVETLTADASGTSRAATRSTSDLFIAHCAMCDWGKAGTQLERLLAAAPGTTQLRETLGDLDEIRKIPGIDTERLRPLRRQLEDALPT